MTAPKGRVQRLWGAVRCPRCGHDLARPVDLPSDEQRAERLIESLTALRAADARRAASVDARARSIREWCLLAEERHCEHLKGSDLIEWLRGECEAGR